MGSPAVRRILTAVAVLISVWLALKYIFALLFPFVLGTILAFAAEPAVSLAQRRLPLPRWLCAGIGVTLTLILLSATLYFLIALAVRELGHLANALPDLQQTADQGLSTLQNYLHTLSAHAPDGIQPFLNRTVSDLFGEGSSLFQQFGERIGLFLAAFLSRIPDSALGLATAVLASFMISARLDNIKAYLSKRTPPAWKKQYLPMLSRLRKALGSWLKAQIKLIGITYAIVTLGLILLAVPYAPVWALLVAVVDAFPVLGTGTVLLPWSLVCLLRGAGLQALGLLCIYGVASLTRSVLEPRLVGRGLGIDPLVTLVFFYIGYKLLGLGGILLAPLMATAVKTIMQKSA